MPKKLYVGNLPWSVLSSDLGDALRGLGLTFKTAEVVFDGETERSRGFAFVHFELDESAEMAREVLDGHVMGGRTLVANVATSDRGEKSRGSSRSRRGEPRGQRQQDRIGGRGGRGRAAGQRDDWGGR